MDKNIKIYWLVIINIVIIAVFVFIQTAEDDNGLVNYFSFAGSVTSLVLGLVAIFYSIVSNNQSSENFGKLNSAVTKIEEGAATMKTMTESINSRLDKISDDIVQFRMKDQSTQVASSADSTTETPVEKYANTDTPDDPDAMDDNDGKEDTNG